MVTRLHIRSGSGSPKLDPDMCPAIGILGQLAQPCDVVRSGRNGGRAGRDVLDVPTFWRSGRSLKSSFLTNYVTINFCQVFPPESLLLISQFSLSRFSLTLLFSY